ncbi:MAG: DEAD/DEAH box helicase [Actinomycetia bacterium]|nr:DEAD/DEAH box helicase [Actinomycetes bacterium]
MIRPAPNHELLVATILPESVGLWVASEPPHPPSAAMVEQMLGQDAWRHAQSAVVALETPLGQRVVEVTTLELTSLGDLLVWRSAGAGWSSSLRWLHALTSLAARAAASGRALPMLRTRGLRWQARWAVIEDATLTAALDELTDFTPPVLLAASPRPAREQVGELFTRLVDSVARAALVDVEWKPSLPRSRSAAVVATRRAMHALRDTDDIFVGDTSHQELVISSISSTLSDHRSTIEGAPAVSFRGRLVPPAPGPVPDDESAIWKLELEAVASDDATAVVPLGGLWTRSEAALTLSGETGLAPLRARFRRLAEHLAAQHVLFAPLVDQDIPDRLELDTAGVSDLLTTGWELCRSAGLTIVAPAGLAKGRARLTASASSTSEPGGISHGLGRALVDVDWGVALGDLRLSEYEIEELARSKDQLVAFRGSWIQVDRAQIREVLHRLGDNRENSSTLSAAELLRESIESLEAVGDDGPIEGGADLSADGWVAQLLAGLPDETLDEAPEPRGFVGELRHYQRRALGWLQFLSRLDLGGCLADDMGLGKTPTALAHLTTRTQESGGAHPHLVICPLSVVANWTAEAARFTPELRVMVWHGTDRPRDAELEAALAEHDILITTYGLASRAIDELAPLHWDVVVLDEAQAVKNHRTKAARAIRRLDGEQVIALTGTPVENRLAELWSILDVVNPGMVGGHSWFRERFANPIEGNGPNGDSPDAAADREVALADLRRLTGPFVLRRTKADRRLVPDLPDKVEQVAWATLTAEQAGLYKSIVDDFLRDVEAEEGMKRRGLVLATLTRLKQVCNHPLHYLAEVPSGSGVAGRPGRLANRSGKLNRFDELVDELLDADERALVFTQYRTMGALLVQHLESRLGHHVPFLHGGVERNKRTAMVESFQSDEGQPIQIVSLRAGGTGLNLTAASRVIHYDRWWNPAVEDQATDRAWRLGQQSTVFVHKLVCQGTLEERIDELLTSKRTLADAAVGTGEAWLTELSTDELRDLLILDPHSVAEADS